MNYRMKTLRKFYNLLGRSSAQEPFSYIVNNAAETEAMTLEYLGNNTDVAIPSTIDGITITEIGPFTFLNHTDVTSIVIPNSVEKLD